MTNQSPSRSFFFFDSSFPLSEFSVKRRRFRTDRVLSFTRLKRNVTSTEPSTKRRRPRVSDAPAVFLDDSDMSSRKSRFLEELNSDDLADAEFEYMHVIVVLNGQKHPTRALYGCVEQGEHVVISFVSNRFVEIVRQFVVRRVFRKVAVAFTVRRRTSARYDIATLQR